MTLNCRVVSDNDSTEKRECCFRENQVKEKKKNNTFDKAEKEEQEYRVRD